MALLANFLKALRAFLWPRSKKPLPGELEKLYRGTRQSFTYRQLRCLFFPGGPRVNCLPSGPPDAQCWFECFFPAPKKTCVCFAGRPEAPELFACPQALQMLNVGLNAFSAPKNAWSPSCLLALMLNVGLSAFSQPRKTHSSPLVWLQHLPGLWLHAFSGACKKHSGLAPADRVVTADPLTFPNLAGPCTRSLRLLTT